MLEFIGAAGIIIAVLVALFLPVALAFFVSPVWLWLYMVYALIILIFACLVTASRQEQEQEREDMNDDET